MNGRTAHRLLDVGCGDGGYAGKRGWPSHYDYVGVDIDQEKVEAAQDRGLDVRNHDVLGGLPFDDDAFGRVVAKAVLEHVDDPLEAAKECHRVLQPGGSFLVIVPSDRSYDLWGDYSHVRAFRRDALEDLLNDAWFKEVVIRPRMGWTSAGMALKSLARIAAPWTPYGYPRAWWALARGVGNAD